MFKKVKVEINMQSLKVNYVLIFCILFFLTVYSSDFIPRKFLVFSNLLNENFAFLHTEKRLIFLLIFFSLKPTRQLFVKISDFAALKSPSLYIQMVLLFLIIFFIQNIELNIPISISFKFPDFDPLTIILIILSACVIAPVQEEIFFRGILFTVLSKKNVPLAFIVTAILFSLIHIQLPISSFVMSLVSPFCIGNINLL